MILNYKFVYSVSCKKKLKLLYGSNKLLGDKIICWKVKLKGIVFKNNFKANFNMILMIHIERMQYNILITIN